MIEDLLQQDCHVVRIERNSYGDIVESDPIPYKCRAMEEFKLVKNNAGEQVVSSIQFWLPKEVDINVDTLTNRRIKYNEKDYIPISVRNRRDTYGKSIFKVVFV